MNLKITSPGLTVDLSTVHVDGKPVSELTESEMLSLCYELGIKDGTPLFRVTGDKPTRADKRTALAAKLLSAHMLRLIAGQEISIVRRASDLR